MKPQIMEKDGKKYKVFEIIEESNFNKICLEAVKKDGRNIQYIPEKLRSKEMCLIAVKRDGWNIQYIPEELRTYEICKVAVEFDKDNLNYVKDKKIYDRLVKELKNEKR